MDRNKKKQNKNILIRFQEEEVDYLIVIVVFKNKENEDIYQLRSAYPLFFKSSKKQADEEYEDYIKNYKK